jgi:glycosyltransferase involved in cell wall biosynthesis
MPLNSTIVGNAEKSRLLVVGGFPAPDLNIIGGIVTECQILLSSSLGDDFELILIDSTQISNPPPSLTVRLFLAFRRFVRFSFTLFSKRPDAVLLFTSIGASVLDKGAMAWLSRMKTIPVFLAPRGAELIDTVNASLLQKIWVKIAMRGATHFLCQGPAWQRFAIDVLGFMKSNAPIILNWTATKPLLDLGAARTLSVDPHIPILLFLGWLEREKGIFECLEACLETSKRYQLKLVIAGRGHAEQEARDFVTANNLQDIVEFVGWVQGADKENLLRNTDILVLPSWAEGFPNAIIEAMAAKVAVIVTTVGNIPDLITDRQEALLVPPKDCLALGHSIEILLKDIEFRNGLAERGHIFARENFSVEKVVAQLALTIEQAIEQRRRKSCVV